MPIGGERELIEKIQGGDRDAENQLISLSADKISIVVHRRIGREHENCKDLIQDIFVAVLESLRASQFDPLKGQSLQSYIYGITRNKIRDYFKCQSKKEFLRENPSTMVQVEAGMHSNLEKEELRDRLRYGITKLKKKYREVLFLRYFEELSISEISERIGSPKRRVSERINYAIKLLKKECDKLSIFRFVFLT